MCMALKELSVRGAIRTTIEYLRAVLETDDFTQNATHTRWLETQATQSVSQVLFSFVSGCQTHLANCAVAIAQADCSSYCNLVGRFCRLGKISFCYG